MDSVEVRGARVAFEQVGRGHLDLVLVHGFQNDHSAWDMLVERLDRVRFRVTRYDHVGCGASSAAAAWSRCTIDEYAKDLLGLCDALAVARPILVGHSLGGATALRMALDHPKRVRALALVAPASTRGLDFVPEEAFRALSHPTQEEQARLLLAAFRHPPPAELVARLTAVVARATPEHIEGAARAMRDFRCADELSRLTMPAILMCGDCDRHVPLRNHLATHQAMRRCGLAVYPDIGHVPFVEAPECFAADLLSFVDRVEVRATS